MNPSSDARDPVELLAEEFLDRKRSGEQPTLREYLERHPDLAAEIRDLFPALLMMEDLGESSGGTTGSLAAENGAAVDIRLQRLGDYRILREIGRGGMGVVYEAEQESLGRRVALKVLSAGSLLDPKQVRRFEREAKAAAKLHHTNIVPVFGVGRQDGHHYFVMQFIAGLGLDVVLDDLRRVRSGKSDAKPAANASRAAGLTGVDVARSLLTGRLDAAGPARDGSVTQPFDGADSPASPPPANGPPADSGSSPALLPGSSELSASSDPDRQFYRSIARVGIQVAEALEYANRQGILHRDVKPSNLLLDNHGNVWVADFGLAKMAEADDLTHTGDILGTIRYMAPERFSGHCDARSDVYSLGLTLYEMVALRPAYEASDRHRLMERVLHEEPERLEKLALGVPRDLETIVSKSIARDPAMRYATAAAFAEDLRRFVEDRPIRARRVSSAERFARWCRRNKLLATSMGLAVAGLVAAAVSALLYAGQQGRLATAQKLYAAAQSHRADEQAEANQRIAGLASNLEKESGALKNERANLRAALSESNRRLAMLDLERGQAAFEKGQVGAGMLWTVESLRMADAAGDEAGRHVALDNLSAWRRHLVEPKAVFSPGDALVKAVAFSPDGQTVLTGCSDMTARLWDVATGRPIGQPMKHSGQLWCVAFSPDGKTILTGSADKTVQRWDAATGQAIGQPLTHPDTVMCVAVSPDGKTILTASEDKTARVWDAASGRAIGQPLAHPSVVMCVAFSPDGKTILTGSNDQSAWRWDAATGQPIGQPLVHQRGVLGVAFSPDGRMILTGSRDKMARLWDAVTGRPIGQPLAHSGPVHAVAFSPDGETVLTGCDDKTAQLWDAVTGQRIGRPLEHQGIVSGVAFSPDGRSILTGSWDGMARLWDREVGQSVGRLLDYGSRAMAMAFSPDGKNLVVASGDGKIRLWDVASGHPRGQPVEQGSQIYGIAVSPNGRMILTGNSDKTARLWDTDTGRLIGQPMVHSDDVWTVAFSPDGQTILTASDKTARLWDADTRRPIGQPLAHSDKVFSVAFSPDGKTVLTGCQDRMARLWDVDTGRPLGQPIMHSTSVWLVAFSPDGHTILTSSFDKTMRLWDATTGRSIGQPMVHSGYVWSAAFSHDGRTILTGCSDKTARLWDAVTCQPIGAPLPHSTDVWTVAFSPDGRSLLTSDYVTARWWDAPVPLPCDPPRLAAWVEAATGLDLDNRGTIRVLDRAAVQERRRRLEQLGGPPPLEPAPRLDPILFGPSPAARGNAWKGRGEWDRALAAYVEATRVRPLNRSVWDALVRLHVEGGRLDRAASVLAEAVRLMPDDPKLRQVFGASLLASGDRGSWRRANTELLGRYRAPITAQAASEVAWACVLAPDAITDSEAPVRLAEAAIRDATGSDKVSYLNTLGAALYRSGRFDEAIRRLEEGIRLQGGEGLPSAWAFLAMAHHRLGHRDQARRWLDRLRERQPSSGPDRFWDELEVRLLRSEAEAVIHYDPVFPTNPFAH
jgi:eukaryotic-like serine/threonine-protein kinase